METNASRHRRLSGTSPMIIIAVPNAVMIG